MKRIGSHWVYSAPGVNYRNSAVEINDNDKLVRIIDLTQEIAEPCRTLFYNGIISASFVSVAQRKNNEIITTERFNYIDLRNSDAFIPESLISNLPCVFDFGTENPDEINKKMPELYRFSDTFDLSHIVEGCVYNPRILLGSLRDEILSGSSDFILWENNFLADNKMSKKCCIRKI